LFFINLSLQSGQRVVDLYEDLRDGENLVALLEVLSQELLVVNVLQTSLVHVA